MPKSKTATESKTTTSKIELDVGPRVGEKIFPNVMKAWWFLAIIFIIFFIIILIIILKMFSRFPF